MDAIYIGVDPGSTGYIVAIVNSTPRKVYYCIANKPAYEILNWVNNLTTMGNISCICIEDVHSVYGASAKSNFTFGFNCGFITGVMQSSGYPVDTVQPKTWHKRVGVYSTAKEKEIKQAVAEKAKSLYPTSALDFYTPRGKLIDGKTDALMIAHYCMLNYNRGIT